MRVAAFLSSLLCAASAAAQAPSFAIVGATVETGTGETLEGATVVVKGERIVAVGANVEVPAGAQRVDASGMRMTPGFIGLGTGLGLVEIELEASTVDLGPQGEQDPVRAAFDAADGFNARSSLIPVARSGGVTTALSTPMGGLVSGTSAVVELRDDAPDAMVTQPRAALHVDLGDPGVGAAGGARPSALSRLREAFDDARLYANNRAAFDRRGLRQMRTSRLDLQRLADALAGRLPVVVRVSRAGDIPRVLALGRELGIRLILEGAEEGWAVASTIAAARVPVIVQPLENLPFTFSALGSRLDNAALLAAAGVEVSFGARGAYDLRTLRQEAGNAVARGLPWQAALAALTSVPARALGIDRDHGSIAAGKVASFVLWTGDPFELSSRPLRMWVRGRETSLRTRQTALFERYRNLAPLLRRDGRARTPARRPDP